MKERLLPAIATIVLVPIAFWLYGAGRTMCETEGLNIKASSAGLFLSVVVPVSLVLPWLLLVNDVPALKSCSLKVAIGLALVIGSTLSECWILLDEASFSSQVRTGLPEDRFCRPRAWPNQGCSLVYVPGRGTHATD